MPKSRYAEVLPLILLVLIAGGIWAFAQLADEVKEGETRRFDERVLLSLRNPADRSDPLGPAWVEETERDFTALGGVAVMVAADARDQRASCCSTARKAPPSWS